MKFGGTSVSTAERWSDIGRQVSNCLERGERPLVVVSAVRGVTNALESFLNAPNSGDPERLAAELTELHLELAANLGLEPPERLRYWLGQMRADLMALDDREDAAHQARVLSMGELLSSALGAAALQSQGLDIGWRDARDLLRGQAGAGAGRRASYLSVSCGFDRSPELEAKLRSERSGWITQGFIARSDQGETVLLGRGGSDTSAACLGARLAAKRVEIWTDVPGMFSANPHLIPSARLLQQLSFREAQEIASTGARVLHPRCIEPARQAGIPLEVRDTANPTIDGTTVSDEARDFGPQIKAIAHRAGITLVEMETVGMWQQVGFLAEVFSVFRDFGLSIDLVSTSESNVTVSLDTETNLLDPGTLDSLTDTLSQHCQVRVIPNCASVSLVGRGIRTILHRLGPALTAFEERKIYLVSQAANDLNITFVVSSEHAEGLVQQLHQELIHGRRHADGVFGPSWQQLFGVSPASSQNGGAWWRGERDRLLDCLDQEDACYVYHLPTARAAAERLTALRAIDRVLYSVKANAHPALLRNFAQAGLEFECVSLAEVQHVLAAVPDLQPQQILFTPNFAPRVEYARALEMGVRVTLDNLFILREWSELFRDREVLVRIDLGWGRGHHKKVRTQGEHAKFGVPRFELDELSRRAADAGAKITGLHAHAGSGVLDHSNWVETARELAAIAQAFPDVRALDLGGGLGIADREAESGLDLSALDRELLELKGAIGPYELWIEPGRYLIAGAGVLLAKVTQVKGKGDVRYVGLATGMNSLIRPALYGAYHPIFNLTRWQSEPSMVANVVGPICETGDVLGVERALPDCVENDVLLIDNAGAYGAVMASRYNLREPAGERVLE